MPDVWWLLPDGWHLIHQHAYSVWTGRCRCGAWKDTVTHA